MFKWLKSLFGSKQETLELTPEMRVEEPTPVEKPKAEPAKKAEKKPTKKTSTKKKASVDLDGMSKAALLAHAKANGIKANASLKKDEILERIKSAN
jgi:hypothetical protein